MVRGQRARKTERQRQTGQRQRKTETEAEPSVQAGVRDLPEGLSRSVAWRRSLAREKTDEIWGSVLHGGGTGSACMWLRPSETPPFCLLPSASVSSFPLIVAGGRVAKAALSQFSVGAQ